MIRESGRMGAFAISALLSLRGVWHHAAEVLRQCCLLITGSDDEVVSDDEETSVAAMSDLSASNLARSAAIWSGSAPDASWVSSDDSSRPSRSR